MVADLTTVITDWDDAHSCEPGYVERKLGKTYNWQLCVDTLPGKQHKKKGGKNPDFSHHLASWIW